MEERIIYHRLRRSYLTIYLLACLVDWLQGPYLYNIYATLNYTKAEISSFYGIGFMSSGIFGLIIGDFADKFGRKKLCIVYFLLTIITCICTVSGIGELLMIGRLSGGVSTSILFSTFEAWYISQHLLRYKLERNSLASTFALSSLYNGLTAITSGYISSFLVDVMEYGPSAPFLFCIPISMISAFLCATFWTENSNTIKTIGTGGSNIWHNTMRGLRVIVFSKDKSLIFLGIVQIIFETVIYIFVFLWAPILEPIKPSYGYIFGILMICIVIGSFLYTILINNVKISAQVLLLISVIFALFSISICTIGVHLQMSNEHFFSGTYLCLISFLLFEFSVGMYLPAISYLRGIILPENCRTSVANLLRLPANLLITIVLSFYIKIENNANQLIFTLSAVSLVIATLCSFEFLKLFSLRNNENRNINVNYSNTSGILNA